MINKRSTVSDDDLQRLCFKCEHKHSDSVLYKAVLKTSAAEHTWSTAVIVDVGL